MHSVYVSCALYMHSVYMHCPAKSYKSFLPSTRYGLSFLCVGNCTQHTAIIVLEMVPLYFFFYGLWGSALLCDNILHNIARKGFCLQCNAARIWMKECLCNFYFHVYCMLVVSVPQLTKLWKIVLNIAGRRMGGEQLDVALPVSWIEASETYPDGSEQVQLHTQLRTHRHTQTQTDTQTHTQTQTHTHRHRHTHRHTLS